MNKPVCGVIGTAFSAAALWIYVIHVNGPIDSVGLLLAAALCLAVAGALFGAGGLLRNERPQIFSATALVVSTCVLAPMFGLVSL